MTAAFSQKTRRARVSGWQGHLRPRTPGMGAAFAKGPITGRPAPC
jgi:hypothetical protein